jgi:S1-C subfamily serine protease
MRNRLLVGAVLAVLLVVVSLAHAALSPFVVTRIKQAVVYIEVTLTLPGGGESGGSGSGFVIARDGQVVTNAHVVSLDTEREEGGTVRATRRRVLVTFYSGTEQAKTYEAVVKRENPDLDLALLKIDLETPAYLELADSEAAVETTPVYVCGHPLGLKEISIHTGTISARRTWEGRRYIEHDAMSEPGNSGGPLVDQDGRVVGIHSMTLTGGSRQTKFAIPSNVLRDWLATPPEQDPVAPKPGATVKSLLEEAGLEFKEEEDGIFSLPYEDNVNVKAHQWKDFFRVFVRFGEIPGKDLEGKGETALKALAFNYDDPVGRLSLWKHDEEDEQHMDLYWECQIPMSAASPKYVRILADVADSQAVNWQKLLRAENLEAPNFAYPGGELEELLPRLKAIIQATKLKFSEAEEYFSIKYDNEVTVHASIYKGMIYTHCYVSGMLGLTPQSQGRRALAFLEWNWYDDFGRLALDTDRDLVWESQVPYNFMTPDFFAILCETGSGQVADFWNAFGRVPLNGD